MACGVHKKSAFLDYGNASPSASAKPLLVISSKRQTLCELRKPMVHHCPAGCEPTVTVTMRRFKKERSSASFVSNASRGRTLETWSPLCRNGLYSSAQGAFDQHLDVELWNWDLSILCSSCAFLGKDGVADCGRVQERHAAAEH